MLLKTLNLENILPFLLYQENNNASCIVVSRKNLLICLSILKKHIGLQYKILTCISAVDLLVKDYCFLVAYELLSLVFNSRLRVKIFLDEYMPVPSIIGISKNVDWWEREISDFNYSKQKKKI